MSLEDLKIKDSDISSNGVVAAPDKLMGTAQENKKVFDRLIREMLAQRFNALIDYLQGHGGAGANSSIQSDTIKYFRITGEGVLEWSEDGKSWTPVYGKAGSDGADGSDGTDGSDGADGSDGSTTVVSENIGYIRVTEGGQLEISTDGEEWTTIVGSGGAYTLPVASATTLGGVKIGEGLAIDENGVLSVTATAVTDLPDGDEVSY